MKLYAEGKNYTLYNGNMLDMLEVIEPNSIDAIITDPPYELNFMSKGWDRSGIAFNKDAWERCFKVLKSGGYLLAFGGSRTFHRIACAIEDAGFEIRDTIMWLYGSGFPKSMNIGLAIDKKNGVDNRTGKIRTDGSATGSIVTTRTGNLLSEFEERQAQNEWSGWGTALKPSYEPIIVARKPCKTSVVENVLKYGVGGINIDECRVGDETISIHNAPVGTFAGGEYGRGSDTDSYRDSIGRFPANTILTYDDTDFEEVCGGMPETTSTSSLISNKGTIWGSKNEKKRQAGFDVEGSASRYFYCAKASKKDRDEGLDQFEEIVVCDRNPEAYNADTAFNRSANPKKNTHPTVKPCELMQYLVRLVSPKGSTILDCFNGSGSTGKAVMYENLEREANYKYIGIELSQEYLDISKARIESVLTTREIVTIKSGKIEGKYIQECLFEE